MSSWYLKHGSLLTVTQLKCTVKRSSFSHYPDTWLQHKKQVLWFCQNDGQCFCKRCGYILLWRRRWLHATSERTYSITKFTVLASCTCVMIYPFGRSLFCLYFCISLTSERFVVQTSFFNSFNHMIQHRPLIFFVSPRLFSDSRSSGFTLAIASANSLFWILGLSKSCERMYFSCNFRGYRSPKKESPIFWCQIKHWQFCGGVRASPNLEARMIFFWLLGNNHG